MQQFTPQGGGCQVKYNRTKIIVDQRGWGVARLARRLGRHKSTISRLLSGDLQNPELRRRIAQLVGIKADDLFSPDNLKEIAA